MDALGSRVVVLDGAMGTMLQQKRLTAEDFGGDEPWKAATRILFSPGRTSFSIFTGHTLKQALHIIETNTFGGNTNCSGTNTAWPVRASRINREAAKLARRAAEEYAAPGKTLWVAGSMGPTTKAITVTGGITFSKLRDRLL